MKTSNRVLRDECGELHCSTGPALVTENGQSWWVHGTCTRTREEFQARSGCSDEEFLAVVLRHGMPAAWEKNYVKQKK